MLIFTLDPYNIQQNTSRLHGTRNLSITGSVPHWTWLTRARKCRLWKKYFSATQSAIQSRNTRWGRTNKSQNQRTRPSSRGYQKW